MNREDPEQLFEIFEGKLWNNSDDIIRDISDKLIEFGYTTMDASDSASDGEYYIRFACKHGTICGHVWIYKDEDEEDDEGYKFVVSDCDIDDRPYKCSMCKKVKTVKISNKKTMHDDNRTILDRATVEEIIKLIEKEDYLIVDDRGIIVSDEDGIVLTLREILKGEDGTYRVIIATNSKIAEML